MKRIKIKRVMRLLILLLVIPIQLFCQTGHKINDIFEFLIEVEEKDELNKKKLKNPGNLSHLEREYRRQLFTHNATIYNDTQSGEEYLSPLEYLAKIITTKRKVSFRVFSEPIRTPDNSTWLVPVEKIFEDKDTIKLVFFFKEYSEERYLISGISKLPINKGNSRLWVNLDIYCSISNSKFDFSPIGIESISRSYFAYGARVGFGGYRVRGFISGELSRNGSIAVNTIAGRVPSLLHVDKNGEKTGISSWTMWEAGIGGEFHAFRRPRKFSDFYLLASVTASEYRFNLRNPDTPLQVQVINYSVGGGYRFKVRKIAFSTELWYSHPREINETLYIKQDQRISFLVGISFHIGK